MARIIFDDAMITGIDMIDEQHRELVEIYNHLNDAYHAGRANREMGEILAHLVKYTRAHFKAEEELMVRYGYDNVAEHRVEHADLLDKLKSFVVRFTKRKERISTEILDFVANWIQRHILESDMDYAGPVRQAMTEEAGKDPAASAVEV